MATTLSKDYLAPIITRGLHKVRAQKCFPRALAYGPLKCQGHGISDPWAVQLIEHVHALMRHHSRGTLTGKLLATNIDNLVLELGSVTPFWELSFPDWEGIATPSWLTATSKNLHSVGLTLKGDTPKFTPSRVGNTTIMDDLVNCDHFTDEELGTLNLVGQYKEVIWKSDICTASGTHLLDHSLIREPPPADSPYEWPKCRNPLQLRLVFGNRH